MTRITIFLWLTATLVLSATAIAQCPRTTPGPTTTSLTIAAVKGSVEAASPVLVRATLVNKSNQNIVYWLENAADEAGWLFDVEVRNEQGRLPIETKFGSYHGGHAFITKMDPLDVDTAYFRANGSCFTLTPGASVTYVVDAGKIYALDEPGAYTIIIKFTDPASGEIVKSDPVIVTVVPAPTSPSTQGTEQSPASASISLNVSAYPTTIR